MAENSEAETRPSYIKRIERINPEKQLTDVLTKKFGQKFSDYRKEYFKILDIISYYIVIYISSIKELFC